MLNTEEMIAKVNSEIERIDKKENKLFFFIIDTKGNPSGSLYYIYRTAMELISLGYNVEMLHQESEFVGPYEWLGEKYSVIPHKNVEKENIEVKPSDFLFIPELYSNIMGQVKDLPCKKIIIFQNFEYLTEFFPLSADFNILNISSAITTSKEQEKYIKKCFPYLKTNIVEPVIDSKFRESKDPKKLIVNIVARNQTDVNKIVKLFYWNYPIYKWVSFRDLRGMTQEKFSDALRDGAITVWVDTETNFGYSAIEALRSGSILIGKVPDNPTDWMIDENNQLTESVLWFDNVRNLPDMLASVVRSWTMDAIPNEIYENMHKFDNSFTNEAFKENVKAVYCDKLIEGRKQEFVDVKNELENKEENK